MVIPYPASFFPHSGTLYPPGSVIDLHGGTEQPGSGGTSIQCYFEPQRDNAYRDEAHRLPEGVKKIDIFTATDIGARVDGIITVNGLTYSVKLNTVWLSDSVAFRTECVQVP